MKTCSVCNKELKSTNESGLCAKHYQIQWRLAHPGYAHQKVLEYNSKNTKKLKEAKKKYFENNKDHLIQKGKEWYEGVKTTLDYRYKKAKSTSKQRKIDFNLTFEEYKTIIKSATCHYCNTDLSNMVGHGLDRVSSEAGYNIDNVLPCCNTCNKARNTFFTVKEWKVAMKAILNLREENERCQKVQERGQDPIN